MFLWDIRIASRVPSGFDLLKVEDVLFDALQETPGVDLWTGTADPTTGRLEMHFGLLVPDSLRPPEALQRAIARFMEAAAVAGWVPEGGDAELLPEESHFEITYQGSTEVEESKQLALA